MRGRLATQFEGPGDVNFRGVGAMQGGLAASAEPRFLDSAESRRTGVWILELSG